MKVLLALVMALFIIVQALPAYAAYEKLFTTVKASAWAIYLRTPGGMNAICSATAFESDQTTTKLLTAGHCFMGTDTKRTDFLVTQDHKNFVKAELITSGLKLNPNSRKSTSTSMDDYEGHDWAIIRAYVGNQPVLAFGESKNLSIGEDLVIVGVPFGMDFLAVQGILGSTDLSLSTLVWNHYFGANIYIAGGNSGSAVVSTTQKKIVGIVVAGPGNQSSLCIFAPIQLVLDALIK